MGVVQWGLSGGAHGSGPMGSKWRGTWEWSNVEQVEGLHSTMKFNRYIKYVYADLLVFLHNLL